MVIGAGIGGLTLAHGLRQADIDVVVYEKDDEARPQGVTVALSEMGAVALRGCLPPSNFSMLDATAGGSRTRMLFLSESGGRFSVVREVPAGKLGGPPVRPICRRILRAV